MTKTLFKKVPRELEHPNVKVPILHWWEGCYEKVFIAFNPFVRVPIVDEKSVHETITVNGIEYLNSKLCEGNFDDIFKKYGQIIKWSDVHSAVCPNIPFMEFARCIWISVALGRRDDVDQSLQDEIEDYCDSNAIFYPHESCLSPVLEPNVRNFLKNMMIDKVDVYDEFRHNKFTINVSKFSQEQVSVELPEAITGSGVYGIHSKELGLLMSWDFECVEGLIGLSSNVVSKACPEEFFEGFYVTAETYNDWLNPVDFFKRDEIKKAPLMRGLSRFFTKLKD